LDGIAFAVAAGRAILADDMGLGKTIQGIGVAQMLAQDANISRVFIICPASLKSQWRLEIERATDRTCCLVLGSAAERARTELQTRTARCNLFTGEKSPTYFLRPAPYEALVTHLDFQVATMNEIVDGFLN